MDAPSLLVHVRHGESIVQPLRGHSRYFSDNGSREAITHLKDIRIPLTNRGKKEALETGIKLKEMYGVFDVILYSKYLRSKQTAEAIIQPYNKSELKEVNILETELLNERDMGHVFNLTEEEVREKFPGLIEDWKREGEIKAQYPGGDSLLHVRKRMLRLMDLVCKIWMRKKVCLVGHWGTSITLRGILEELSDEHLLHIIDDEQPPDCAILAYELDRRSKKLILKDKNLVLCGDAS